MIATKIASNGQRVSRMSSLRMFRTVLKPINGRNRPKPIRPAIAACAQRAGNVDAMPRL